MNKKTYKPGEIAPHSGQYAIIGPRGGNVGTERTIVKKEHFPPTPKPGQSFVMVDPTRNKAGGKR